MKRTVKRARRVLRRAWRSADPVLDLVDPSRRRCYPKDYDELERYKDRFPDTARLFEVFVKRSGSIPNGSDDPVAVAVMSWFGTPSPWYAIAIGLGLARRGRSVVFIWHDIAFPELSRYSDPQNEEIERVLRKLEPRFRVVRLSEQPPDPNEEAGDGALLDGLAEANLMWNVRGADPTESQMQFCARMRKHMADALPRVRSVMRDSGFRYAVAPGGVVGPSGLYLDAGRAAGIRVATFDAGLGWTEVNTEGVAAQQTDMGRAFELLVDELGGREEAAIEAARTEFDKRRSGLDLTQYQHQHSSSATAPPGNILIPLSVIFDASALGRHHLFADSKEWLVETIGALLEHTKDPILVRQHPSERRRNERSRFDVKAIVDESFGSKPQVEFIAAEDPQSTYDLLEASRLVLPFVSTIGIEAAALGKPVIISGAVYYAGLGFVRAPSSRDAYLDAVRQGARGELPTLPGQVDRAWLCYYLNAVCHRVWTNFTPQPPDFWRWVARQPDELYSDAGVDDILTSIDENVPLPILRHRRLQGSASDPELADQR